MPPKKGAIDLTTPESVSLLTLFQSIGVSPARSREVVLSAKSTAAFQRLIDETDLAREGEKMEEKQAGLCVELSRECGYEAGEGKERIGVEGVRYVVGAIREGKLKSNEQVKGRSHSACRTVKA